MDQPKFFCATVGDYMCNSIITVNNEFPNVITRMDDHPFVISNYMDGPPSQLLPYFKSKDYVSHWPRFNPSATTSTVGVEYWYHNNDVARKAPAFEKFLRIISKCGKMPKFTNGIKAIGKSDRRCYEEYFSCYGPLLINTCFVIATTDKFFDMAYAVESLDEDLRELKLKTRDGDRATIFLYDDDFITDNALCFGDQQILHIVNGKYFILGIPSDEFFDIVDRDRSC